MLCDKVLDYSRKTKLKDRGLLYKTRRKCEVNLKVFKILILVQKLIVFLFFLILSIGHIPKIKIIDFGVRVLFNKKSLIVMIFFYKHPKEIDWINLDSVGSCFLSDFGVLF